MSARAPLLALSVALGPAACSEFAEGVPRAELGPLVRTGTAALTSAAANAAGRARLLVVGPNDVKVRFEAAKLSGRHQGHFTRVEGQLMLDPERLARSRLVLDIDMASVETDTPKLTQHLKSADFFGVETYPQARFELEALAATEEPERYAAEGSLQMHGIRRSLSGIPIEIRRAGGRLEAKTRFVIDRKAFGIVYAGRPDDLIAEEVILEVALSLDVDAPE